MPDIEPFILAAKTGELAAYGKLVELTQRMVYAVCRSILRNDSDALDAVQETFLTAFVRLKDLDEPAAWPGWLRRIAVNTAKNIARRRRFAFTQSDDVPDVPVLDETETAWSTDQRSALSRALLILSAEDRKLCDRFYHGRWSLVRLAADANVTEAAMRKRMQRVRDRLRLEIEMSEQHTTSPSSNLPPDLSEQIVALLARPNLVDLPENPVGRMNEMLTARYPGHRRVDVPEVIDVTAARRLIGNYPPEYQPESAVHYVGPGRLLRPDLTVPLLLANPMIGAPARLMTSGPVYRNVTPGPTRDLAFHQFEVLVLDRSDRLDPWNFMGQTLRIVSELLPGRSITTYQFEFPACSQIWEVGVDVDGKMVGVLAWGVYTPAVVRHLGGDPAVHTAVGLGFGIERMAAIHYGYDDIRQLAAARV